MQRYRNGGLGVFSTYCVEGQNDNDLKRWYIPLFDSTSRIPHTTCDRECAACISFTRPHLRGMIKLILSWRRPLFYLLLPVFFVMIFLGFPIPVPPPPATKSRQEESAPARPEEKR